ncbi:MAG: GFA family protein [Pseudomonadota bacterium]
MLTGRCHCGAVGWTFMAHPTAATACNCTLCRRYGALWAYGQIDHDITTTGHTATYRRADDGQLDVHFCTACGCMSHFIAIARDTEGRQRTAVNLRLCDTPDAIRTVPIRHFDGLDTFKERPHDTRCVADLWF